MGEYLQKGIDGDKNLNNIIRKYDEAQAEGHVEAMNALGALYYNDIKDFN